MITSYLKHQKMGELLYWKCNSCNYAVTMSGGKDRGFQAYTQTFQCLTCKELMDIAVDRNEWDMEQWEPRHCKKCNGLLKVWDTKTKLCPCCGGKMIDSGTSIIMWD
jgi:predicted RNA-binding Zn-ribbon protein involved in translation (DUF1610 family)